MNGKDLGHVLDKLYFRKHSGNLIGFQDEKQELYKMLEATVTLRRGDSCMIIGPRNSGKSVIVDSCVKKLQENFEGQFILVRLHGMLHPDDKTAFREIARQIDELTGIEIDETMNIEKVSLNSTLQELFKLFGRAEVEAYEEGPKRVSIIFILEDMDRFTAGHRQSLLYNLLDFTKNSTLGIAVVGTTAKFTTQEALEKRVRSRFGSLVINTTRAPDRKVFDEIAFSLLDCSNSTWNERIKECLETYLKPAVDYVYYTTKDPRDLGATLAPLIYKHHSNILDGTISEQVAPSPINIPASTETRLKGQCELDWAILICATRSMSKYSTDEVNFVLVNREYREMARNLNYERSQGFGHSGYRVWSAKAVKLAWERLEGSSMIARPPASVNTHRDLMSYRVDTSLEELRTLISKDHPLYSWTRL